MFSVSRVISRRLLQQGVLSRATSVIYPRFLSSESDGDDLSKTKTAISSLLSSLKKTDRKVDLEDVLQKKKLVKQNLESSTKTHEDYLLKYDHTDQKIEGNKNEDVLSKHGVESSNRAKDTMTKIYSADHKQPVSPEMNDKLKSILLTLKVDTAKSQLSKDIVGAVKSWGRMSPRSRKELENDFIMQSQPEPARIAKGISLTSGAKLDLFDDIFGDKTSVKETLPSLKLLEGEDMELLEKQKSLDQRNDFLTLIEIADKQWKFPIDNEVCKVEEESVGFEEHIFLGYLLDSFPKKGPVRRFMELVVNGLEQNPYMTVGQKRNQVTWFEEYFKNVPEEDLSF